LVATWGLPASVTHAIAQHHTPLVDEAPLDQPATLLHLAHALAAEAGYTNGIELEEDLSTCVATYLARHDDDFQVILKDFVHEMQAAACLYQGEGS
jgi:HD-like signal output (HDOD) protein